MLDSQLPLRYDLEVPLDGRVEVKLPLPAGTQISVYVVEQSAAEFDGLLDASVSSTSFWDNPADDRDWNNA